MLNFRLMDTLLLSAKRCASQQNVANALANAIQETRASRPCAVSACVWRVSIDGAEVCTYGQDERGSMVTAGVGTARGLPFPFDSRLDAEGTGVVCAATCRCFL